MAVDREAKTALYCPISDRKVIQSDFKEEINPHLMGLWQNLWDAHEENKLHSIDSSIKDVVPFSFKKDEMRLFFPAYGWGTDT